MKKDLEEIRQPGCKGGTSDGKKLVKTKQHNFNCSLVFSEPLLPFPYTFDCYCSSPVLVVS